MKLGIVVANYNSAITEKMLESAEEKAKEENIEVEEVLEVPGAYDTPLAADKLARKDSVDAVVALGAIISGDTSHDEVIGHAAAEKLSQVSLDRDTPVMLGITGPGMSSREAKERVDYAAQAVESAKQMHENLSEVE